MAARPHRGVRGGRSCRARAAALVALSAATRTAAHTTARATARATTRAAASDDKFYDEFDDTPTLACSDANIAAMRAWRAATAAATATAVATPTRARLPLAATAFAATAAPPYGGCGGGSGGDGHDDDDDDGDGDDDGDDGAASPLPPPPPPPPACQRRTFVITPTNIRRVTELLAARPCRVHALLEPHRADASFVVHSVAADGSGVPPSFTPSRAHAWQVEVEVDAEEDVTLGASHFGSAIVGADGRRRVPLAPRDSVLSRTAVAVAALLARNCMALAGRAVTAAPLANGVVCVDVLPWERAAVEAALPATLAAAAAMLAHSCADGSVVGSAAGSAVGTAIRGDTRIIKELAPRLWVGSDVPPHVSTLLAAAAFVATKWREAAPAVRFTLGAAPSGALPPRRGGVVREGGVREGVVRGGVVREDAVRILPDARPLALCNGLCVEARRALRRDLRRAVHRDFCVEAEEDAEAGL